MESAGRERGKETGRQPQEGRRARKRKKILKQRERTQGFVENTALSRFSSEKRTQNEPKTNSFLSTKAPIKAKEQDRIDVLK
jgi:hypothetical protein